MDCETFARLSNEWKGKCCIFGAGNCGSTWGYEIVKDARFDILCYVDNFRKGDTCNGYPVYGLDYLEQHKDLLCFVAIMGDKKKEVLAQLEDKHMAGIFCLPEKEEFLAEFPQYLDEYGSQKLKAKYVFLMDDKKYLTKRFKDRMGYEFNWNAPVTFNEKLNWLKIYDRKPYYTDMVDKYAVKAIVAKKIGSEHVIPTIGVWDSFDKIDFDKLPEKFVLKCTHDSGSIVFCEEKDKFNKEKARDVLQEGLKHNYFWPDREWPYYNVPRKIIAEKYIDLSEIDGDRLEVYKIFNFHGVPTLIQHIQNDKTDCETIDYFDTEWNLLDLYQNFPNSKEHRAKPEQLGKMLEFASVLSEGHPFIRTDFYIAENSVLFSEFTFYSDSGCERFHPSSWDEKLGNLINIDS